MARFHVGLADVKQTSLFSSSAGLYSLLKWVIWQYTQSCSNAAANCCPGPAAALLEHRPIRKKPAHDWQEDIATTPTSRSVPLADTKNTEFILHELHLCKPIKPGRSTWVLARFPSRSIALLNLWLNADVKRPARPPEQMCRPLLSSIHHMNYFWRESKWRDHDGELIKWTLLEVKSSCF